ncbi:hypothetical protein RB213_007070 [Colletotrichum asianum]
MPVLTTWTCIYGLAPTMEQTIKQVADRWKRKKKKTARTMSTATSANLGENRASGNWKVDTSACVCWHCRFDT